MQAKWYALGALGSLVLAIPANAEDCPSSYICASNPAGIVNTLQTLGYKATLGKSEATSNPKISTSASGYDYDIFFYGCTDGAKCTSIGFMVTYEKDPVNSADLANQWNKDKRFSAMSFDPKDQTLSISYDVTTIGGLNQVNFADVVDWWETMLGQARTFFKEHPAPAKKR
ncbi:MAG: YbjN domain-containing protein [Novosphingobium sp.]